MRGMSKAMIKGDDFLNSMTVFGFLVYLIKRREITLPLDPTPFTIRFIELNDYERLIIANETNNILNLTVRNDDDVKAVHLTYGQRYNIIDINLTPGRSFEITLQPKQSLSGRTYWGTAQISILIQ